MIKFYIIGQTIRFSTPAIAADSLNHLEAEFNFAEAEEWAGASKWAHFRQEREGEAAIVYDIALSEDRITAEQGLNLTVGEWEVYLTGTIGESRLTTIPVILTVYESGLIDGPLHEMPMTVAEQIDIKASTALNNSKAVLEMAENGEFNGRDGTNLSPLGHFNTAAELEQIVEAKKPGDVYSVGYEPPYEMYSWDGINLEWRNQGRLQGVPGEQGKTGATYTPYVDLNGNLSWTNNGGLENPPVRNIMGEPGKTGDVGPAGPGAYEKAKEAGYTGTEATFYAALTYMPYHHTRHEEGGADPLVVSGPMIKAGAVTPAKLAAAAKPVSAANVSPTSWTPDDTYEDYPYKAAIAIEDVTTGHHPEVVFNPRDAASGNYANVSETYDGGVYIYAETDSELPIIPSIVCFPMMKEDKA